MERQEGNENYGRHQKDPYRNAQRGGHDYDHDSMFGDSERYRSGSEYGTRSERGLDFERSQPRQDERDFNRPRSDRDFEQGERSRRRLSAGSEQPFSSQRSQLDYPAQRGYQESQSGLVHEGQFAGRGPKGYRRSDERIHEEVCDRLADHAGVDASEIEVKVEGGHVTLTGTVDSRNAKRMAEDAVEHIRGIHDISNQLRVEATHDKMGGALSQQKAQGAKKGDSLHS